MRNSRCLRDEKMRILEKETTKKTEENEKNEMKFHETDTTKNNKLT